MYKYINKRRCQINIRQGDIRIKQKRRNTFYNNGPAPASSLVKDYDPPPRHV